MRWQTFERMMLGAILMVAVACGNDKAADAGASTDLPATEEAIKEAYKQKQAAWADSVLRTAPNATQVVKKLGPKYDSAPLALSDAITVLAKDPKYACHDKGKAVDPYLAGVVSLWVNMSVIGADVIQVQTSQWTSELGTAVNDCLNTAAKSWTLSASLAKPGAYIAQVQFR